MWRRRKSGKMTNQKESPVKKSLIFLLPLLLADLLCAQSPQQLQFFEKKIRPILASSCAACHNAKSLTAGMDLSTTEGIRYAVQYGASVAGAWLWSPKFTPGSGSGSDSTCWWRL
jgi:hypothetical protein